MRESTALARRLDGLFDEVATALKPPPKLKYSVWAERYLRVPAQNSATPGRFRPWKPQRGLLDAMGDPLIERVTVLKAARVGYSKCLMAAIAADAANDPSSTILLMPTEDDCRDMAVDEIDPMFKETPVLRGLMMSGRLDGRNTLTKRQIVGGGSLKIIAARSPRNLRKLTARKLYVDEADGMEITKEGDPIDLAIKRTLSFADRKIIVGSTPTDDIQTFVGKLYAKSDQRIFMVPCAHCGEMFEILWDHIKYDRAQPSGAICECPNCAGIIEDRHKLSIVEEGDWIITRPEVQGHAGFRLNALVSLFANASWARLAQEYEEARAVGPFKLMVFQNTVLGLVWSDAVDSVDENALMARAEAFALRWDERASRWREDIPREVLFITAGVDVQPDRAEIVFVGWSRSNERWFLGHEVVHGLTNLTSTWDAVDSILRTQWTHPLGGKIGVEAAAVDSGDGNRTQDVYNFCGPRAGRKVVAIKGREGPIHVIKRSTSKRARAVGAAFYIIGVDQVKTDLALSAKIPAGSPAALRFSGSLTKEWFRQFTAERRKTTYPKGRPKVVFERVENRAAEALDCCVYGVAVRGICRFDFDERQRQLDVSINKPAGPDLASMLRKLHS